MIRSIYEFTEPEVADEFVARLASDLQYTDHPIEVRSPGPDSATVARPDLRGRVFSNGPTEAVNNCIKRVERIAFRFRKFRSFRIRALLYAGEPNWDLQGVVTPR